MEGKRPTSKVAKANTLAWGIEPYRNSSTWAGLSNATRRQRENIYRAVTKTAGNVQLREITQETIRAGRERRKETPHAAIPLGTRGRLALDLTLCTGFRRWDLVRVGRQHVRDTTITIRTEGWSASACSAEGSCDRGARRQTSWGSMMARAPWHGSPAPLRAAKAANLILHSFRASIATAPVSRYWSQ
jgi:hypothetical protein